MFGFMSKEKKREKKAGQLILLMHDYTKSCVVDICNELNAKPYDQSVRELINTDDSYQFWYTVGLGLSWARGFDDDMATVVGMRTLMEFLGIENDKAFDRGVELHRTGEDKVNQGVCDRNSKVQCAAATVIKNLERETRPTTISLSFYVTFICKLDGYGTTYDEIDMILEEGFQ